MSIRGPHHFSAMAKRHVVFFAEFVRQPIALDAKPRLQRIFRVIDAGAVHAAVARAGGHAQLWKLLYKKNALPAFRNAVGDSTATHPPPNTCTSLRILK